MLSNKTGSLALLESSPSEVEIKSTSKVLQPTPTLILLSPSTLVVKMAYEV